MGTRWLLPAPSPRAHACHLLAQALNTQSAAASERSHLAHPGPAQQGCAGIKGRGVVSLGRPGLREEAGQRGSATVTLAQNLRHLP